MAKIASRQVLEEFGRHLHIFQAHQTEGVTAIGNARINWIAVAKRAAPGVEVGATILDGGWRFHVVFKLDFDVSGGE